jgi:hypothetical protein
LHPLLILGSLVVRPTIIPAGWTGSITTDDALKKIMSHHSDTIPIRIVNPAVWYEEVTGNESEDPA